MKMDLRTEWRRRRQGLSLECGIRHGKVFVGESCSNPHGPNSETSCTLEEFAAAAGGEGRRVRSIVADYFGKKGVTQVLASVKAIMDGEVER